MKLLREPLVHFLLLGAALFIWFELTRDAPVIASDAIEVTSGLLEHLVTGFERTWQRPPNDEELLKLVQDQVRDEVFYREAVALGLEKDDTLIRRRLRQKLETMQTETAEPPAATEAELQAYFSAHTARYEQPPAVAFDQVFVDPSASSDAAAQRRGKLAQLQSGEADPAAIGDASPQPAHFELTAQPLLALAFGEAFVDALTQIKPGVWTGPVESKLGLHLVRVNQTANARVPELGEVRDAVERDWKSEQLRQIRDEMFRELQERYPVTVTIPGQQGARIAEALGAPQAE